MKTKHLCCFESTYNKRTDLHTIEGSEDLLMIRTNQGMTEWELRLSLDQIEILQSVLYEHLSKTEWYKEYVASQRKFRKKSGYTVVGDDIYIKRSYLDSLK